MSKSIRFALTMGGAALFAGCGELQPPIGAPSAVTQKVKATARARHASGSSGTLVYATGGCGGTCVLSYQTGKLVASLPTAGDGICSDRNGNVFIANNYKVVEYAHGGTEPVATLSLPGTDAAGCSIDPTTGNLAVVFINAEDDIAVFPGAQGTPTVYTSGLESEYCGYDAAGNLFVSGYNAGQPGLSELQSGGSGFGKLSIDGSVMTPGQVQWDGQHMAYEGGEKGQVKIFRLNISDSAATIAQTIAIKGISGRAYQSWIYGGRILFPYSSHHAQAKNIGLWKYPKAGAKVRGFNFGTYKNSLNLAGVTVSVAPSR